jgi:hypothetical protein
MTELNATGLNPGYAADCGSALGRAVATGMLREAQSWAGAQCALLSGMEAWWGDLMRRQREALDHSSRSLRQMGECRDLADILRIQQQWFADVARRGAGDVGSLASDAVALTWQLGAGGRAARSAPERAPTPAEAGDQGALRRAAAE